MSNYYLNHTGAQLDEAIRKVLSGELDVPLQEKTVTPNTSQQIILPDAAYKGLSKIIVNAIPQSYIDNAYDEGYSKGYEDGCAESSRLPNGYTELTYIQSSGTQYIDTGYKYTSGDVVTLVCSPLQGSVDKELFGSRPTAASYQVVGILNSSWRFHYQMSKPYVIGQKYTITLETNGYWYLDGVSTGISGNVVTGANAYLFASNNTYGSFTNYCATARVWSLTIKRGDTLIRDFVPCKTSSGAVGLYDIVNREFYPNIGTGTFTGE